MLGDVTLSPWAIVIVDAWMWTPYVMLICLAGLRSIPDYIYEAAEVDRASPWRQFWSITLPMALPFIMLAVLFRGIENFKMFDMVNLLTGGGPGRPRRSPRSRSSARRSRSWRTGYSSAFAIILFVTVFGLANIYVKALNRVKSDEPAPTQPIPSSSHRPVPGDCAGSLVVLYAVITMIPLVWIVLTSFKSPDDAISYPPKIVFTPSLEGYCNLFTTRSRQTPEFIRTLPTAAGALRRDRAQSQHGRRRTVELRAAFRQFADHRLRLDRARGRPRHVVGLRVLALPRAAEGRSAVLHPVDADDAADRGRDPDLSDVPHLGLSDTRLGMILLYTSVNVSLAVWLLKGFIDEIPREYEEAAMIDGYTRFQAFVKVVLPQATTGIAATAIFCLIFAWNEYAFAVLLTSGNAQTAPPFIPIIIGEGGQDWPAVAAGTTLFLVPIVVFTVLLAQASAARHYLWSRAQMSLDAHSSMPGRGFADRILRRGPLEAIATTIIAAGVVMLMQPFSLTLYSWSFATTLFGTVMFIIVSKVRE